MRIPAIVSLLLGIGASIGTCRAQSAPAAVTVTSDSASYCQDLARREPAATSETVGRLWREGKTLCDQGHVRSGIMQLRRALQLAREERDGP